MRTSAESIIHVWITSYFKQQLYVELYLLFAILGRVHMFNSNILHIWLFTLTNVVGITNRPYIWRGYNLWYWGRLNTLVFVTELSYDWLYPIKKCSKAILGTWQMSRCASSDEQATRRACRVVAISETQRTTNWILLGYFPQEVTTYNWQRFPQLISFFVHSDQLYIFPIEKIGNILAIVQWKNAPAVLYVPKSHINTLNQYRWS